MKIKHSNYNYINIKIYDPQCTKPLNVIIKDILPGVSQIDFYRVDKYYSATWAAMKTDMVKFVISISDEFLSKNCGGPRKMIDDNNEAIIIIKKTAFEVHGAKHEITLKLNRFTESEVNMARNQISREMLNHLNENDSLEIIFPTKVNPEWNSFCRTTKILREGLIKYKEDTESTLKIE
ncbi:hypothetical protein L2729_12805 [Shewanella gelidimarina]|uniref:hypothetical protein n=1 Tax=Shewanella gelidimarina TaxID=56813 RepID=UPI00200D0C71|nr:hypothetical protein [Shewanella gelidimarina]MCL1058860.1 hypothetical protein [Shewanella gelidimarina]